MAEGDINHYLTTYKEDATHPLPSHLISLTSPLKEA